MRKKYYIGRQAGLSFSGGRSTATKMPLFAILGFLLATGFSYLLLLTNRSQSFTTLTLIYAGITLVSGCIGGYFAIRTFKGRKWKILMLLTSVLSLVAAFIGLLYFVSFMSKTF